MAQSLLPGFDDAPLARDSLFLAVLPAAPTAAKLEAIGRGIWDREGLCGTRIPAERLHVTLCALGTHAGIPPGLVTTASSAAAALSARPFAFTFDRAMSFSGGKSKALVLCGGENTGALIAFRQALAAALVAQGFGPSRTSGFTPHVTLGYAQREITPCAVAEVRWDVAAFALVHSVQGESRHVVLARWPLRA